MQTVVEVPHYLAKARKLLTPEEMAEAVDILANDPECGDLIEGTGGIRKVRVAVGNRGKSSGARVIYYYRNGTMPLYLLDIFAKNEKANLTKAERNAAAKVIEQIVANYRRKGSSK